MTFERGLAVVPNELILLLRLPTTREDFELGLGFTETDFDLEEGSDLLDVTPKLDFCDLTDFEICACAVETVKAITAGKATPTTSAFPNEIDLWCDRGLRCVI